MSFLRILAIALVFSAIGCSASEIAEQTFAVSGTPLEVTVPAGWIRIPEKALSRIQQSAPGFQSNYVAGFAGPRSPPNTPMTILLVQILPVDITPKIYVDSAQTSFAHAKVAQPARGLEREGFRVGLDGRAAMSGMHGQDGRASRTYALPSSKGVIEFSIYCPAKDASATFALVESCLNKLKLTEGAPPFLSS